MKFSFTLTLILLCISGTAQWSNTNNLFTDSSHLPVTQAVQNQQRSISLMSYPDSGYIVFWTDYRNSPGSEDIYAQKFDKNGNALWQQDGVPVATGPNPQTFWDNFNAVGQRDYRNYSYACTDSAGGFYIAWKETFVLGSYHRTRVAVQHVRADGSCAYPGSGLSMGEPQLSDADNYVFPQIVPDGRKGFFLGFVRTDGQYHFVYVRGLRPNGGTLENYSTKLMNQMAYQRAQMGACGLIQRTLQFAGGTVMDYHLWPNGQAGCNVVMTLNGSDGSDNGGIKPVLAYNAVWRAKRNATTRTFRRNNDLANTMEVITHYERDSVYQLYTLNTFTYEQVCLPYIVPNQQIENFGLGYLVLSSDAYDQYHAKGVTLSTNSSLQVNAVAVVRRKLTGPNTVSPFITRLHSWAGEIYDSIPYQLASTDVAYLAYNMTPPASLPAFQSGVDTLLTTGLYYHDFSIAASNDRIAATAKLWHVQADPYEVYLQQLKLNANGPNAYSLDYNTADKGGIRIGKEINSGAQETSITYDDPRLAADSKGNFLFYTTDFLRGVRVSPLQDGAQLSWGSMGRLIGTGLWGNGRYSSYGSYATVHPSNGTAVMSWQDNRFVNPTSADNIYLRNLSGLNTTTVPPYKPVKNFLNGAVMAMPYTLLGSSQKFSLMEASNGLPHGFSPVAEISDNFNLGNVQVNLFQHIGANRTYNGKPYLNRNWTIKPQNDPAGGTNIHVRLFFTEAEFAALQSADPTILTPGDLSVVKQPNATITVPSAYAPVAGEQELMPVAWQAVNGGYYVEVIVNSFSNFFIQKSSGALPVTWLGIAAQWQGNAQARVSWEVTDQINVRNYIVQHSTDGMSFSEVCTVSATAQTAYNCLVPAVTNRRNYYRVLQQDLDGRRSYSSTVILHSSLTELVAYPNPASDRLYIIGLSRFAEARITDIGGKTVWRQSIRPGSSYLPLSCLPDGLYLLHLSGEENRTIKFIKANK